MPSTRASGSSDFWSLESKIGTNKRFRSMTIVSMMEEDGEARFKMLEAIARISNIEAKIDRLESMMLAFTGKAVIPKEHLESSGPAKSEPGQEASSFRRLLKVEAKIDIQLYDGEINAEKLNEMGFTNKGLLQPPSNVPESKDFFRKVEA
ncbi:hypothetical protein SUGI_0442310 [Cryptomeria japonica]|nr:hypothetical protein SUGI_0442310 [Cryptomeria japonica]